MKDNLKVMPIHICKPFKGTTTIVHISKEGDKISFNNLPNEYMPEIEKLIRKLSRKFGRKVVKYLKSKEGRR
jgi:hypothetical protein